MRPENLLARKMGFNITVDAEELARAQWFWERRPKKLILSTERILAVLIFYAVIWTGAMCLGCQESAVTAALTVSGSAVVAVMLGWAYFDTMRFARWSSDYSLAIARLLHTVHRRSGGNSYL